MTSTPMQTGYTIGECARRSGFSMDTLRYYERVGLIDDVDRTATGQRRFSDAHLEWLGTLKCLRDTGMPVEQMCRFARLVRDGDATVPERIELLQVHREAVNERIADLDAKRDYISGKIAYYQGLQ
ncbi:MerR family transcriptional regulator [Glycomyces harbinensis]|uniref:DNA-binding transcriptional regulator, MerR family n=1 Tax=Glycomyces harbinensis TaxID=58114 RepID=A0A1G6RBQ0_9ACTN|nr:MerR family transcriptional regulator [Glycomyces harbinensis]SDD01833.1 DNA-binding transcriptional regulator, MerR family [Glycomyces harbinensis]